MARVTVEDCVRIIPNRFELVLLASQRARDISAGQNLSVERDNDKNPVVALREIAEQSIDFEELRRHITGGVNRHADLTMEDDEISLLSQEAITTIDFDSSEEIQEVAYEEKVGAAAPSGEPTEDEVEEIEAEKEMINLTEGDTSVSVDEKIAAEKVEEQIA